MHAVRVPRHEEEPIGITAWIYDFCRPDLAGSRTRIVYRKHEWYIVRN